MRETKNKKGYTAQPVRRSYCYVVNFYLDDRGDTFSTTHGIFFKKSHTGHKENFSKFHKIKKKKKHTQHSDLNVVILETINKKKKTLKRPCLPGN